MKEIAMGWARWLGGTAPSQWIAFHEWVVPTSQSFHIVGIALVISPALMIGLRLLGIGRSLRSISQLVGALTPWMHVGLALLLVTGCIQILAEPAREFVGDVFWWKMGLILLVVPLTLWFTRAVKRDAATWDAPGAPPAAGRVFGVVSIVLWLGIVFCGRFIAYTFSLYALGA